VIDGQDNSVVFRIPVKELEKSGELLPEQLTSVEANCSYPRPQGARLLVTCAFEGALDIYEAPATGIIPSAWNEKLVWNAHQTARTYHERILLLNALRYRGTAATVPDYEERLLSDHLLADDSRPPSTISID